MRGIGSKIAAIAFAAVFAGSSAVDALGLHSCPHHGSGALAGARAGHDAAGGRHGAGELHQSPATSEAGSSAGVDQGHAAGGGHPGHGGPCTCVGTCSVDASSPLALLPGAAASVWSPALGTGAVAPAPAASLPGQPPFLLPYSHGPPPLA